ncbi:MAG TPA: hypothetical protein VFQ88_15275 [Nevskiaceae bacterium]|nr:hypothetical protein [Nevskiaceae bacterium]
MRIKTHGHALVPVRIKRRHALPPDVGAFSLNSDLVPKLLGSYWDLHESWVSLVQRWSAYRAWQRAFSAAAATATSTQVTASQTAQLAFTEARSRLAASGYRELPPWTFSAVGLPLPQPNTAAA